MTIESTGVDAISSNAQGDAMAIASVHTDNAQHERSIRQDAGLIGNNAFMGSATLSVGQTSLFVHALCWPIVPTAWRSMAQAWDSVGGWRDATEALGKPGSPSWIAECATQLGSPFRGSTAEESTIAAILTRTPMSVAISVLDGADTHKAIQRQGFLSCLSSYDTYVKVPGRRPCTILVGRGDGGATNQGYVDAFAHTRQRLPAAEWLQSMELHCWADTMASLPLEAAHVIATSVARYRVDGNMANPIVDAIRPKLAYPLELLDRPLKKRR